MAMEDLEDMICGRSEGEKGRFELNLLVQLMSLMKRMELELGRLEMQVVLNSTRAQIQMRALIRVLVLGMYLG